MSPIPPGSVLGVLGSGQLGRMFAIAARQMGYRVHVLSPDTDTPTGQVADVEISADYQDLDAVARFARDISVLTFEFENVPVEAAEVVERFVPVRPAGRVLHVTQHRLREKGTLHKVGLPVTPFIPVSSAEELHRGLEQLGTPAVLKTAAWGYDGKGQHVIRSKEEANHAWKDLGADEAILEAFIDFEREISVVGVRGLDGAFTSYGPIANMHRRHILDLSVCPAGLDERIESEAVAITRAVFEQLDVVGVLCVEFFLTTGGNLLINELAPRPHNSGHLTIDAHVSCQFEQQVRAICGLPLGSTRQLRPATMANLLGDLWSQGDPDFAAACAIPEVKLHLYGKREPRPGRKMGHLTALGDTADEAIIRAEQARQRMHPDPAST